jgi:integrase
MENKVAKPLGLTSRGGSLQLRIIIPQDLREAYGGRKDFRISLGKLDRALGWPLAHRIRAEKEAEFAEKRKELNAQQIDYVTPDLAVALAERVYAELMTGDDAAREDPQISEALQELANITDPFQALRIPTEEQSPQSTSESVGLTSEAANALAGLNKVAEGESAINLARRNLTAVKSLADNAARKMGLLINWTTEDGRAALKRCLEAYRKGWKDRVQRDEGEIIETPVIRPVKAESIKEHYISDVVPLWESVKQPAASTKGKMGYSVKLFNECFPGKSLKELTKADGTKFISFLLEKCSAQKTAKDHFDNVKSLLNFACDHQDWISGNPWKAHGVTVKKSRPRKPWTSEDLIKLFDSDLFKSYSLPTTANAGKDAAYWVPLLGLYTGARQSELCQLRLEDVVKGEEGLTLSIIQDLGDEEDDTPETSVKNLTTQRRIPVHSELIRLGFADYVEARKRAGDKRLFPAIPLAPGRPAGEYFSDWFRNYRNAQGITKRYMDFHAFRHTSRTRLTDAGVEDVVSAALMGHTATGSMGQKRYDHSMAKLRPALELLSFPELNLKRVYK